MTTVRSLQAVLMACALVALSACGGSGGEEGAGPVTPPPPGGFGVEVTPASALAFAGSGRLLTVTLTRAGGFTADVTVVLSNPPAGVTAQALVFSGSVASLRLPVNLNGSVPPGNLALAVSASSGTSSASATAQLSVQAAQPRAKQKIAAALAASTIDRDTSLLYRLYALTGDPRLPAAFVGSGSSKEDVGLFAQIQAGLPQMAPDMQAAVRRFLVRPDHPDSVYRRPDSSARTTRLSAASEQRVRAAAPPPSACASGARWRSIRSTNNVPVRVWSECHDDAGQTAAASAAADKTMKVLEKIWTPMIQLMGSPLLDGVDKNGNVVSDNGGDDAIDVYLVESYWILREGTQNDAAEIGDALAYAQSAEPCASNSAGIDQCSGYVVLPAWFGGTELQRSAIIHEFFHVLQFAHNRTLVDDWFSEASALWAETYYDRKIEWPAQMAMQSVHFPWLDEYIQSDASLAETGTDHQYAAYLWPFFLEQETGSNVIIGQIWRALEAAKTVDDQNQIIDTAYGFDANFRRFALRNVNEELTPGDPVRKRYVELPGVGQFPECLVPECVYKPVYRISKLVTGTEETRHYSLQPLSARYTRFLVEGKALPNRVEFDFSGLSNRGSLKLDALIRTTSAAGHEWVSEPVALNPDSKAVFCFELGKSTTTVRGEFNELRLVLSNSSKDKGIAGDVIVRPTLKPCGVWEGAIASNNDETVAFAGGSTTVKISSSAQVAFAFDAPNSSGIRRVFRVRSGNYGYRAYSETKYDTGRGCRTEATASGAMQPKGESTGWSDGATDAMLRTFSFPPDFTPQYDIDHITVDTTVTTVSNCNSSGVDETSTVRSIAVLLWMHSRMVFDIKQGGTTMKETYSEQFGGESRSSTWLLTRKSE